MIEMLVFFVLNLLICILEELGCVSLELIDKFANQFPVQMVFVSANTTHSAATISAAARGADFKPSP